MNPLITLGDVLKVISIIISSFVGVAVVWANLKARLTSFDTKLNSVEKKLEEQAVAIRGLETRDDMITKLSTQMETVLSELNRMRERWEALIMRELASRKTE